MFNVRKIRDDFPVLKRLISGRRVTYLDSTASSLKPRQVIDAINGYYNLYSVNIFRGIYSLSEEATARYEEARVKVANFIGAASPREVVFVRNATEAINLVCQTWAKINVSNEDEIVSTVMEHHANIVPWQQLGKEKGFKVKFIDIIDDGTLDQSSLEENITPKTKLLAITLVSNVLGTINPLKKIISEVRRINPSIKVLVDGAQAVPHMAVNVADLNCDFFVFSGHKMLGPTGIGVLWAKYEILENMPPYQMGGDMIREVYLDRTVFQDPPHKFEAGTPHIAGTIGLGAAVDYLTALGMDNVREHEKQLISYAVKKLDSLPGVRIYGPKDPEIRGGVLAFNLHKVHPHDLAQVLDSENICIRSGHHCAMPLHTRLNLTASSRASFYVYNTEEDMDKLVEGLKKASKIFNG